MIPLNSRILAAAAAVSLLLGGTGRAQGIPQVVEVQKLVASDGIGTDKFGFAVDAEADTLAIGAPNHYSGGTGPGSVYIFARNAGEWEEGQRFFAPGQAVGEQFGHALSLAGSLMLVGAPFTLDDEGTFRGTAYLFARNGQGLWEFEVQLLPQDLEASSFFGSSVSMQGTTAVVAGGGDVHVFEPDEQGGWPRTARLSGSPAEVVALDAGTIVAAGIQNGKPSGVAYVRDGQGQWVLQSLFSFPEPPEFDLVTRVSVALQRNVAAIGTVSLLGGVDRAHLFVRDGEGHWSLASVLRGDQDHRPFGVSVALEAPVILVGARQELSRESVIVFQRRSTGAIKPRLELVPSDSPSGFAKALTLDGRSPIVGAWADSQIAAFAGSVYVFRPLGP
jgi:hypothetical protein